MIKDKIIISGTGCALADFLYNGITFESPDFKRYLSKKTGDGGLSPGKLVFTEELEKFTEKPYKEILKEITGDRCPDTFNVGGPSLVSMIHVSQLLEDQNFEVKYFGITGQDKTGDDILEIVENTPLNITNYLRTGKKASPSTDVFSDPVFDNGHGERTFVNNIGAAWEYFPEQLTAGFFDSHIVCFGGTALVPKIHENLTSLLRKAKDNGCITVVNTVFDFKNEKNNPGQPWPLVDDFDSYGLIDLLIMDCEEAIKISGKSKISNAASYFSFTRVSSFIITNGAKDIISWSNGKFFKKEGMMNMPVSKKITEELASGSLKKGDTTGCGDNFAGGVIASVAYQLKNQDKGKLDFIEALSWGIASGGFCCFQIGGTYLENFPGEKREAVRTIQREYLNQIHL